MTCLSSGVVSAEPPKRFCGFRPTILYIVSHSPSVLYTTLQKKINHVVAVGKSLGLFVEFSSFVHTIIMHYYYALVGFAEAKGLSRHEVNSLSVEIQSTAGESMERLLRVTWMLKGIVELLFKVQPDQSATTRSRTATKTKHFNKTNNKEPTTDRAPTTNS